ncbi:hypothetical protein ILUMI_26561 [Ignelater luminosus]|uniref:Peptidase S1 domain-containing protein n=1 Tax=Ignelater luminosus TaxID=2038154 RepID=A0A8K0C9J9_IGNLU|nr:hypothetical protein ILUMI_26561 [Ignelater luminosus]
MVITWSSLTQLQKKLMIIIVCLAVTLAILIGFTIFLIINTDFRLGHCKKRIKLPPIPTQYSGVKSQHIDIVNDTTTTVAEEFSKIKKFIVSLHYKHPIQGRRVTFCAGSILAPKWLITSSLCMHQKLLGNIYARAGSLYHNKGGTIHKIVDFIIPDWRKNYTEYYTYRYISLAEVVTPFNAHGAVKLPTDTHIPYIPNYKLYTAGWGSCFSYTVQPKYEKLRIATLQMYNPSIACRNYMQTDELKALTVIENVLCAGDLKAPSNDQCNIDAGAPLTHLGVIRGVSWSGRSCKNYPTVYAKVSLYTNWTLKYINSSILDL